MVYHWKMAVRNVSMLFDGTAPQIPLAQNKNEQRIPLTSENQPSLRYTLDYWFTYPYYAGFHSVLLIIAPLFLLAIVIVQALRMAHLLDPKQKFVLRKS